MSARWRKWAVMVAGVDRAERGYRTILLAAFIVCVVLRIPATVQELPPYQFCDEAIFSNEALRLATQHLWVTSEFRSGAFNIYPMVVLGRLLGHLHHLDPTVLVLAGRWFYSVLLASGAVFFVAGSARQLTRRRIGGVIAAALFVLSPTILAVSRYWYPDHYLIFFSAALVYILLRLMQAKPDGRSEVIALGLLSVVLAFALSVKYTFSLAALPTVLAMWFARSGVAPRRRVLGVLVRVVLVGAATAVLASAINFSAFVDPTGFIAGFKFNIDNYSRPGGSPQGIVFYAFMLLVASLGLLGLIGFVTGIVSLRRHLPFLAVLAIFPIVNVVYLGTQGLVFDRNIVVCVPFVVPIVASGLTWVAERVRTSRRKVWSGVLIALVSVAGLLQVAQVSSNFLTDLRPDSQPIAARWIAQHIGSAQTVGVNTACSASPAQMAGRQVENDPMMAAGLKYYVFNSYWDSSLNAAYRGPAAAWAILDQKYLHYYFGNDRTLPFAVFDLPWPTRTAQEVVPDGYEVVHVFDENGPQIVVVRRVGG